MVQAIQLKTNQDYQFDQKLKIQRTGQFLRNLLLYSFLTVMAFVVIVPFYWMLNVSFQSSNEVLNSLNVSFFPKVFSPQNYTNVFLYSSAAQGNIDFSRYLFNTVLVAFFTTLGGTLFSILVAFALARLNFKGRDFIFTVLLATMMIPGEMLVISNFVTVSRLGWVNANNAGSYLAVIIPFLVSIFHIYLLRQTFKQIPNELYYAAKVDGCTDFKYLWKVMVPMAKSSIVTIVILRIMGTWNAYIWQDIVANEKYKLVTTWLRSSFVDLADTGSGRVLTNYQMAATVIVTVPLLLLFIFFRKYIMSGVSRSGVKG
ncbi:MAG: carbohydrate ABC transporter permease [Firmicutes bacterium]|nr:carbohydrate ABC transporter permease [Bacillota bacterium]